MSFSRCCVVSLFGVLIGCGGAANSGDGDGDDDGGGDAGVGGLCTSNDECGGDSPYCVDEICVECRTSGDCPAEEPVCGFGVCSASCAGDAVAANFVQLPSDIIWVVDQSNSMNQETDYVQEKINDFADAISASNIDYRVVMIARTTQNNAICVPAPLSNGSCGNHTRFRLVNRYIDSHNGPSQFISRYDQYSDFLRPEAMKHVIFVTDDNASKSADDFIEDVAELAPAGMFDNYKVHAIYAYGNGTAKGCDGAFGEGAAEGTVYTSLVSRTGGERGVICEDDWSTVFADIQEAVVSGSQVSCEIAVPAPSNGQTLDPSKVNVKYETGGVSPGTTLLQVQDLGSCSADGWYYDDNVAPTKITLCPAMCSTIQNDPTANVSIELGCSTQIL